MGKKISLSVTVALILISMTVTFAITMIISMRIFDSTVSNVMQKQVLNNKIAEIDKFVRGNFYGTIDENILQDKTSKGYIDGLQSAGNVYYSANEYAELQDIEDGKLVGIGLEVIKDLNGYYKIAKVYPGSPAETAKIQEGGYITSVGSTEAKNFSNVAALQSAFFGSPGTTVDLSVRYETTNETVSYQVQRVNYTAPTVESSIVDGIAYIRINAFNNTTNAEFDYAVREAEDAGVMGLVFDVRNNNSGLDEDSFKEACLLVSRVSPLGNIGYYLQKNNTKKSLPTSDAELYTDLPMVVLVNENTGGAAELFALGIKELDGGQIAGTRTMGKFMMLSNPQRLSDGSAISITIAQVFPASETDYNGTGITPDIEIIATTEENNPYKIDLQTDIQILRGFEILRGMAKLAGTNTNVPTSTTTDSQAETEQPSEDIQVEENNVSAVTEEAS